ncbi:FliM/FliN family flagellar motor switch protein, partial [Enterobacter hormaechei]|nr:FliM/FliN family flagellar motor switch protein [Enterobacter hormaechei]
MSDAKQPTDTSSTEAMWAEALEQQAAQQTSDSGASIFENLDAQDALAQLSDIDLIMDIPVKLSVELGRTKMTIYILLRLSQGSFVPLDGLA